MSKLVKPLLAITSVFALVVAQGASATSTLFWLDQPKVPKSLIR